MAKSKSKEIASTVELSRNDVKVAGRGDFLGLDAPRFEDVAAPEFGEGMVVRLQAMDARRHMLFGKVLQERGMEYLHGAYVAACAVDADGEAVFTVADIDQLMGLDGAFILRLSKAAQRVCGVSRDARDAAAENFERSQG